MRPLKVSKELLTNCDLKHFKNIVALFIKPHLAANHAKLSANIKRSKRKLNTTSPLDSKPKQTSLHQPTSCKHTGQHEEGNREHTGAHTRKMNGFKIDAKPKMTLQKNR